MQSTQTCCPVPAGKCDPESKPERECSYLTDWSATCPDGFYEEADCTLSFYGGLYEHEFCCKQECDKHGTGCAYQDDWGSSCGTGFTEIEECTETSWLGAVKDEFCCDETKELCDPAHEPERGCFLQKDAFVSGCPTGYYEEDACSVQ